MWMLILPMLPTISAIAVTITKGSVVDIGQQELLTNFGMLTGSILFRLGDYRWKPKEIWLLPEGTTPEEFKANSTYLEIPEGITFSTCKTSVYYNESMGYAFKILSSQILENGTFCGLAYTGEYVLLAEY